MRRRSGPWLAAAIGCAALATFALERRTGSGPAGDLPGTEADAPDAPGLADAPELAAGGSRTPRRAGGPRTTSNAAPGGADAPTGPIPPPTGAVLEESALAGALVVEIEALRPESEEPGAFEVRITDPWDAARGFPRPASGEGVASDSLGGAQASLRLDWATTRDPALAAVLRVEGLRQGPYLVSAGRPGIQHPSWMPTWLLLGEGEHRVRLRRLEDAERGAIEVAVMQGAVRVPAQVRASVRGMRYAVATLDANGDGRFEVPVGEEVTLEVTMVGQEKGRPRPPPQTVRVASGLPKRVEFQVGEAVAVRVRVVGAPEGAKTHGRAFLFRREDDGRWAPAGQQTADLAEGAAFVVGAGAYGALATDVAPFAPAWAEFDARPGPTPVEVEVPLAAGGVAARLRLEGPDGAPLSGESVWIGHLGGTVPSEVAVANVTTDPAGWATLPRLPAGEYHVAIRGSMWHPLSIGTGAGDAVLRLPPARGNADPAATATLRGVIVGEGGRGLGSVFIVLHEPGSEWGRYTGFQAGGAFQFDGVAPGDVTLEVPASQLHDQHHAHATVPLRVAAGESRFVVLRLAD